MSCGGFTCSKNALAALNVLYIMVAFILIGVAAYGKAVAIITSIAIMGGIMACGIFLLLIAIVGLIGAVKHHQVLLFFYMIVLFLLFLIQFAVACACLAVNTEQQKALASKGWKKSSVELQKKVQTFFNCCSFNGTGPGTADYPSCQDLHCCQGKTDGCCSPAPANSTTCDCNSTCLEVISQYMDGAIKVTGGIGLFFSFTEIIGVWLALRYRNQKDPRANPSAFL